MAGIRSRNHLRPLKGVALRSAFWLILCAVLAQAQDCAFEAATVRRANPPAPRIFKIDAVHFSAPASTLRYLIEQAYGLDNYQLSGTAKWMDSDFYTIDASMQAPSDRAQVMEMLRRLLAESFHLKTHSETRQTRVYQLVVDKGGSKLQPLPEGESPRRPSNLPANTMAVSPGATLPELVRYLNTQAATPIGWPVVDHTGIEGRFNIWFTLEIKSDPTGRGGTFDVDYFTQLSDKLGLRLVSGREDYSYLVVDGAGKPLAP